MLTNGKLKNGSPSGDPNTAPRCGAHSRRTGNPCRAPAVKGRARCRMHGGKSTGAKTVEGLARISEVNWKHGMYSLDAKKRAQEVQDLQDIGRGLSFMLSQIYKKPRRI